MFQIAGRAHRDDEIGKLYPDILNGWKHDPVFAPYFHETGRVTCATSDAEFAALRKTYDAAVANSLGASLESSIPMPRLSGAHRGLQGQA